MAILDLFPEIDGVKPYKSKYSTPYYEVYSINVPYTTTESRGANADFYVFSDFNMDRSVSFSSNDLKWSSHISYISFFSGQSWPLELAPHIGEGRQFGIHYFGVFRANVSTATIIFKGSGRVRMTGNSISGGDSDWLDLSSKKGGEQLIHLMGLSVGPVMGISNILNIYYLSLDIYNQSPNIFTAAWLDSTVDHSVPLSNWRLRNPIDIFSSDIKIEKLNYISDVELERGERKTSKLTFTIPIIASGAATLGYKYIPESDLFQDANDSDKRIKKFEMVEFNVGYAYGMSKTLSTVRKFTGQVRGWNITRDSTKSTAKIVCYDWMSFLQDTINDGHPNLADYLLYGYLDEDPNTGAISAMPRSYDGWRLEDAVENILYNSYIDPYISRQKQKALDTGGDETEGFYLFSERNTSSKIYLDRPLNYGNSLTVNENEIDSEYIWQFSIGDSMADCLQKLMDNYGYTFGFNNRGYFYTNAIKNPLVMKSIDEFVSFTGSWSEDTNARMLFSVSNRTSSIGDKAVATFLGRKAQLVYNVGPNYGTIHVKMSNTDLGLVATFDINTDYPSVRYYYDGVDDSVGYNPCKYWISDTAEQKYGLYSLNLTCKSISTVSINALFIFGRDEDTPVDTFYSGDEGTNLGVISDSINVSSNADDIRNDVIVVGRLTKVTTALMSDTETNTVINPIEEHILARAIDRGSIGSVSAINYTGRKLQTIIIDPKIATSSKALWLAESFALRYNDTTHSSTPVFSLNGQPLLEVGDKVGIKDINLSILGTNKDFWVTDITDRWGHDSGYKTYLKTTALEPYESYFHYPMPNLDRFGGVFSEITVVNTGLPLKDDEYTYYSSYQAGSVSGNTIATLDIVYVKSKDGVIVNYSTASLLELQDRVPKVGMIKLGKALTANRELIKYTHASVLSKGSEDGTAIVRLTELTRGYYNTSEIHASQIAETDSPFARSLVEMQVDPFMNQYPGISFQLIFKGFVRVYVKNSVGQIVDMLTGTGSGFGPNDGWEDMSPGSLGPFGWGLLDRSGTQNNINFGQFYYSGHFTKDFPSFYDNVSDLGDWRDYAGSADYPANKYKIGKDYFVSNDYKKRHGQFTFVLEYKDPTGMILHGIFIYEVPIKIHTIARYSGPSNISPWSCPQRRTVISGNYLEEDGSYYGKYDVGIRTGFQFHIDSDIISTELGTSLVDRFGNLISSSSLEKSFFYTGTENNGRGCRFRFKNYYKNLEQVSVEIKGIAHVFVYLNDLSYFDYHDKQWKFNQQYVDCVGVFEIPLTISTEQIQVNGDNFTYIYFPTPNIPFVTEGVSALLSEHPDTTLFGISHIHTYFLTVIDNSGLRNRLVFSMYYIDPRFYGLTNGVPIHPGVRFVEQRPNHDSFMLFENDDAAFGYIGYRYDNNKKYGVRPNDMLGLLYRF